MLERDYQATLRHFIETQLLPGSIVLKNDEQYRPGIPDLLVLFGPRWAVLEVKQSAKSSYRPNQEWYLQVMGDMAFSATIYPENEEEVLNALQSALQSD